jgi:hypothetical protein
MTCGSNRDNKTGSMATLVEQCQRKEENTGVKPATYQMEHCHDKGTRTVAIVGELNRRSGYNPCHHY